MVRQSVESSELRSIGYDEGTLMLEVEFQKRGTYQYFGVTKDVYSSLMSAESKGRYFNTSIKDFYVYRRVA